MLDDLLWDQLKRLYKDLVLELYFIIDLPNLQFVAAMNFIGVFKFAVVMFDFYFLTHMGFHIS